MTVRTYEPLTADNAALILVDHQIGLMTGVRDYSTGELKHYLPTVAGSLVSGTVVSALGYPDWGQLAFGAGVLSWLAMESVILHRLLTGPTRPAALRPTLGIQLAPAPVGAAPIFPSPAACRMSSSMA